MKYEIIKGSEKDFEGAPDWCTHVSKSGVSGSLAWEVSDITKDGNKYQWVDSISGDDCAYSDAEGIILDIIAERRPITEPVWDGEGLPPVGIQCLFYGQKVEIIAHFKNNAAMVAAFIPVDGVMKTVKQSIAENFTKIRTFEDIRRDITFDQLETLAKSMPAGYQPYEFIDAIVLAGYRKCEN